MGAFFARLKRGRSSTMARRFRECESALMAGGRFLSFSASSARPSELTRRRVGPVGPELVNEDSDY